MLFPLNSLASPFQVSPRLLVIACEGGFSFGLEILKHKACGGGSSTDGSVVQAWLDRAQSRTLHTVM